LNPYEKQAELLIRPFGCCICARGLREKGRDSGDAWHQQRPGSSSPSEITTPVFIKRVTLRAGWANNCPACLHFVAVNNVTLLD
jgi:hypothetical protein